MTADEVPLSELMCVCGHRMGVHIFIGLMRCDERNCKCKVFRRAALPVTATEPRCVHCGGDRLHPAHRTKSSTSHLSHSFAPEGTPDA